jgi:hypothetical protein
MIVPGTDSGERGIHHNPAGYALRLFAP